MATRTLEARFEHLSISDENGAVSTGGIYSKPKVLRLFIPREDTTAKDI